MTKSELQQSALLLIEFQEEWLNKEGKLRHLFQDQTQFLDSLENAKKALAAARSTSIPIIHSGLNFSADYKELGRADFGLRAGIVRHKTFLADSWGSQFSQDFAPDKDEFVVKGRTGSSAFAGSNLESYLRNNQINTLYIMGYALHVCVESTMRAAHDLGYNVILLEDACTAFTAEQKKYVLDEVIFHFGRRISTNTFIKSIAKEEEIVCN